MDNLGTLSSWMISETGLVISSMLNIVLGKEGPTSMSQPSKKGTSSNTLLAILKPFGKDLITTIELIPMKYISTPSTTILNLQTLSNSLF